jgi:hypothetical protein
MQSSCRAAISSSFEGREYTEIRTFLIISQEAHQEFFSSNMIPNAGWTFMRKSARCPIFLQKRVSGTVKLSKDEVNEYLHRFMARVLQKGTFLHAEFSKRQMNI